MLPEFEELTEELKEDEIKLAKKIAAGFLARGYDNPITSTEIMKRMRENGIPINGPRLRKIIQYIRTKKMVHWLCAHGVNGYVLTVDPVKIKKYTESLKKRENAVKHTRESFPQY